VKAPFCWRRRADRREERNHVPDRPDDLQKRFPEASVKNDRVVLDGNLITSAGGLATYEGALWVVGQLFGQQEATRIGDALVFGPSNVNVSKSTIASK
jgi:transcriptional regulator GlxA family with amidase domain